MAASYPRCVSTAVQEAAETYLRRLEEEGRMDTSEHTIWPEHCLVGACLLKIKLNDVVPYVIDHHTHAYRSGAPVTASCRPSSRVGRTELLLLISIDVHHPTHTTPIHKALHAWSAHARKPVDYTWKGINPMAEMYSAFKAEVPVPGDPSTGAFGVRQ